MLSAACALHERDVNITIYQDCSQRAQEKRQQLLPQTHDLRKGGVAAFITYDAKEGA